MSISFKDLRKANNERAVEWCGHLPSADDLEFCTIEMAGESGEVCDAVKKLLRCLRGMSNKGLTMSDCRRMIKDELGDLMICADRVADCLDIDLADAIQEKFNITSEQHGFKTRL